MMTAGPMLGLAALVATANAAGSGGSPPSFAVGENNVAGVMRNPKGNPPGVLLAGVFKAASGCESAAKANAGATSWTYHHCDFPIAGSGNYSCHCCEPALQPTLFRTLDLLSLLPAWTYGTKHLL